MVSAPDCGSGDRGFESHYPPFFYVTIQPIWAVKLMGYRQAVKAQHFDCCIVGSIPTSPVYGTLAQMVEHLTFNQVVGGSSPPCLTFFLFSFSFFLRRHNNIASSHFACSNEPCACKRLLARWELAHTRANNLLHAYGECRDSEQTHSVFCWAFASLSAWRIA